MSNKTNSCETLASALRDTTIPLDLLLELADKWQTDKDASSDKVVWNRFTLEPTHKQQSAFEHVQSFRYKLQTAENVSEPKASFMYYSYVCGTYGLSFVQGLPMHQSCVESLVDRSPFQNCRKVGSYVDGKQAGGKDVYFSRDPRFNQLVVVVGFDANLPFDECVRNKSFVAVPIHLIDNTRAKLLEMPEELAHSIFKEVVRNLTPAVNGLTSEQHDAMLTATLRRIKKAYADFVGSSDEQ